MPEEGDQLTTSPAPSHVPKSTARKNLLGRKHPIPSANQPSVPPPTSHAEPLPLFLPDSDEEQGPSTFTRTPLFMPDNEGGERPQRKKRRISSKTTQSRTLNDLWQPRKVSGMFLDL